MTAGFDVFVHEVMAAITTSPSVSSKRRPSCSTLDARRGRFARAALLARALERLSDGALRRAERDAVLRALRSRDARLHVAEVEREPVTVRGGLGTGLAEHPLRLGVSLHQRDLLVAASAQLEIAQALGVDREHAAGRAVLGRHVGDGCPVRDR